MKKITSLILVCAIAILTLIACTPNTDSGSATIVIATETPTVYTVDFEAGEFTRGLLSALDKLGIAYTEEGGMLYSVGELAPTAPTYIYIYSSVSENHDVSSWAKSITYEGNTLVSVGFGAAELTFVDGAIFYIGTITYEQ
jgi:hypothetical protein